MNPFEGASSSAPPPGTGCVDTGRTGKAGKAATKRGRIVVMDNADGKTDGKARGKARSKASRGGRGGESGESGESGQSNPPEKNKVTIPDQPVNRVPGELLHEIPGILEDESYGDDERKLNEFLIKHPMCSLEATSQKTLKTVASIFQNSGMSTPIELPVVGKSYDDQMLCPPNKMIGERECICGDRCMATFLAKWRHGPDTDLGFVCTEYLLPDERSSFLAGGGLPQRRKKCLLCYRYFVSFLYYKARVDPTFNIKEAGLTPLAFTNHVAPPELESGVSTADQLELQRTQTEPLQSASLVSSRDGYKPSAMLFVDEEFFSRQAARQGALAPLVWQPVVKFSSNHYKFVKTAESGPRILQVGIGSDLDFCNAPAAQPVAPLGPTASR